MNRFLSGLLVIIVISVCLAGCAEVPGEVSKSPVTSFSVTVEPVPSPTPSLTPAEAMLAAMSTEQKVGQLFFARFPQDSNALEEIEKYQPAGYILFGVNFEQATPEGIKKDAQRLPGGIGHSVALRH